MWHNQQTGTGTMRASEWIDNRISCRSRKREKRRHICSFMQKSWKKGGAWRANLMCPTERRMYQFWALIAWGGARNTLCSTTQISTCIMMKRENGKRTTENRKLKTQKTKEKAKTWGRETEKNRNNKNRKPKTEEGHATTKVHSIPYHAVRLGCVSNCCVIF